MKVIFYLDGEATEELELQYIPRIGEGVRLSNENLYSVKGVVHRYFTEGNHIVIYLQKMKNE